MKTNSIITASLMLAIAAIDSGCSSTEDESETTLKTSTTATEEKGVETL